MFLYVLLALTAASLAHIGDLLKRAPAHNTKSLDIFETSSPNDNLRRRTRTTPRILPRDNQSKCPSAGTSSTISNPWIAPGAEATLRIQLRRQRRRRRRRGSNVPF